MNGKDNNPYVAPLSDDQAIELRKHRPVLAMISVSVYPLVLALSEMFFLTTFPPEPTDFAVVSVLIAGLSVSANKFTWARLSLICLCGFLTIFFLTALLSSWQSKSAWSSQLLQAIGLVVYGASFFMLLRASRF